MHRGGSLSSRFVGLPSFVGAAIVALLFALPASGQDDEDSEIVVESGDEESEPYELSLPLMPFLRPAVGVSWYPGLVNDNGTTGFDLDIAVGARYDLTRGRVRLELVPEIGYAFHYLNDSESHYGFIGAGIRVGNHWIGGSTVTSILLGTRDGVFDLGVRAGLRLEGPLSFIAIETTYEYRTFGGDDLHAIRFLLLVDAGVLLMPVTMTRFSWYFGNRR